MVRAATMAVVAMLGVLLGRTGAGTAILSLAVTVLLVADPWLAGSLGFALSAVATASLLLFARPLAGGLARRMPRPLALALSVPLAAQLACGPLLVIITPTVPLYGVVANLLAAPAAPVATIVGLAACLAAPLPWVQSGLTAIAWLPASWIAGTAHTVSALPGDQVPWIEGWAGVAALTAVGVAIGIVVVVAAQRETSGAMRACGIRRAHRGRGGGHRRRSGARRRSQDAGPSRRRGACSRAMSVRGMRFSSDPGSGRAHRHRPRSGRAGSLPRPRRRRPPRPARAHPLRSSTMPAGSPP